MKEQEVKIVFFMQFYMLIIVLYVIFECLKIGNQSVTKLDIFLKVTKISIRFAQTKRKLLNDTR